MALIFIKHSSPKATHADTGDKQKASNTISVETLPAVVKSLFDYDPLTGVLTWKVSRGSRAKVGATAGCIRKDINGKGRRSVGVGKRRYFNSVVIWVWMTGEWPHGDVDHKDRNSLNDRWDNLRDVTHLVNCQNKTVKSDNTSGASGVYRIKNTQKWYAKKWFARIFVNNTTKHLGAFSHFADALAARQAAEKKFYSLP